MIVGFSFFVFGGTDFVFFGVHSSRHKEDLEFDKIDVIVVMFKE